MATQSPLSPGVRVNLPSDLQHPIASSVWLTVMLRHNVQYGSHSLDLPSWGTHLCVHMHCPWLAKLTCALLCAVQVCGGREDQRPVGDGCR